MAETELQTCPRAAHVTVGTQREQRIDCYLPAGHSGMHEGIGKVRGQGPLLYSWPDAPAGATVDADVLGVHEPPPTQEVLF